MSGKHASRVGALRAALSVALLGARELVVFTTVGVVAPVALLLTVPSLLDEGRAMTDAPICDTGGADCLEPRSAELTSAPTSSTWTLRVSDGTDVRLSFSDAADPVATGPLHVLFWNDDAVALLQQDGAVVGSLRWGPLYGVSERRLLLAPLWPAVVLGLAVPLLWRTRKRQLLVLSLLATGAAASGPTAYVGMLRSGYPGLVAGGLIPVAMALVVAGPALWAVRRRARRPAGRKATVAQQRMPHQRTQAQDPEPAEVR